MNPLPSLPPAETDQVEEDPSPITPWFFGFIAIGALVWAVAVYFGGLTGGLW